ncbi:cbb3-type cytochrome oxidase assembly protein CcoS [Bacteroidetes bacterium endosymbiont of Geopemphigus sp.]|uniref:cbb3-type cytochrome oxidase assembly protein CcoS n=1 Tax=Bacteroidetes bacterium endosymbiont of Geopemphigus sp. TaxID=2047937 RepID=UPI000CD0CF65|nr:cbb3-type cytochrome oxidase assembly protein CcoS [Bacteroidetes bacterium endosymbiont of Geopemphigus sp.]
MDILLLMILASISLGLVFLIIFIINAKNRQFDDDESPALRILMDDSLSEKENKKNQIL